MTKPAPFLPLIGALAIAPLEASAADLPAGKQYFAANCAACHSTTRGVNQIGPSLSGLIGRKSGLAPGFNFSAALRAANIRWTNATLDSWLRRPTNDVHSTRMMISVPSEMDRQNLIAYLRTL
jgi:cytochrome c